LKKYWIGVLTQGKYLRNTRNFVSMHKVLRIKASRNDYFNMKSMWYYENKMRRGILKQHNNEMASVHACMGCGQPT
jgi:hypothetical protein